MTVIGGWIGGLVAAIRCAEQDVPVTLHEARSQLGGRARSTGPPFVANDGPHGLYADGITWRFLLDRRVAKPPAGGSRPIASPSCWGRSACPYWRPYRCPPT